MKRTQNSIPEISASDLLVYGTPLLLIMPFEWTMVIVILFLGIWTYHGKLINVIHRTPYIYLLLAFGALQVLSSLVSENMIGFINGIGTLAIILFVARITSMLNAKTLNELLRQTGKLSVVAAIGGIVEFILLARRNQLSLSYSLWEMPPQSRISFTYFNPNLFATMLIFFLIIGTYFFFQEKDIHKKSGWVAMLALNFVALVMTGCRAALVDLLVIFPIFFLFQNRTKLFSAVVGGEALGLGTLLLNPQLFPRLSQTDSIYARISIWRATLRGILEKPLIGGGPQYYQMLSQEMGSEPAAHAHNLLLELLLSNGIVGTMLLGMYALRTLYAANRSSLVKEQPLYRALVFAMMAAVLIEGLVDCTINFPAPAILLMLVISAPVAMEASHTTRPVHVQPVRHHSPLVFDYFVQPVTRTHRAALQPAQMPNQARSQVIQKPTYPVSRIGPS